MIFAKNRFSFLANALLLRVRRPSFCRGAER